MNNYLKVFKSLSDRTRVRILKILIEAKTPLCVCEIVDSLQVPFYNISRHLKDLVNSGLLVERKEGTFVMYSIIEEKNDFLIKIIDAINSIPEKEFENDIKFLQNRLSLRKDGRCVIGLTKK